MYIIADDDKKRKLGFYHGYDVLVGPDFVCGLTEPEDRNWYRDLSPVVSRLNEQAELIDSLQKTILRLRDNIASDNWAARER